MPPFHYRAYDAQGQLALGTVEATTEGQASDVLFTQGLTAFQLNPATQTAEPWWQRDLLAGSRPQPTDLAALTRELATLTGAEIPLTDALRILSDQASSHRARALASSLLGEILNGAALSDAMQKQGTTFSSDYVSIIRAGEIGGTLGQVLEELADLLERRLEIRAQIQSALVYPAILICVSLAALGIIIGVLVPSIVSVFAESDRSLPPAAQFLMALQARWPELLAAVAVGGVAMTCTAAAVLRRPALALRFDRYKLKFPLLGSIVLHQETARFARTLGTLLRAGVPLLQAATAASGVIANRHIAAGTARAIALVREGVSFHRALKSETPLPTLALRLTTIGEEAGRLDQMLLRIAAIFERQTQHSIDRFMTLLTPILTITMAIVVGGLVMSIMSAMLSINDLALQ